MNVEVLTAMKKPITVYTQDGSVAAEFNSVRRKGNRLIVDGKALGAMQMDMIFRQEEIIRTIGMVFSWSVISYLLLLPCFVLRRCFSGKKAEEN